MNPRFLSSLLVLTLLFSAASFGLGGAVRNGDLSLPENHEIRRQLEDYLYLAPSQAAQLESGVYSQREQAHRVMFEVLAHGDDLYSLFINESQERFDVVGSGNYIVRRSRIDGTFIQAKVFVRPDSGCFVRIFPFEERSKLDLYVFGAPMKTGIVLPIEFHQVLAVPFSRIMQLSEGWVDWDFVLYHEYRQGDAGIERVVEDIRAALPRLRDADDGAMDARGEYVFIETGTPQGELGGLNCSGFAKWVVDGFYRPLAGQCIGVEALKIPASTFRGNAWSRRLESERDPYFGLDWSRYLATRLAQARTGILADDLEEFDVRLMDPFPYTDDIGYPTEGLAVLLFRLAQDFPGYFYIGSLNRDYGENPILRQHFHVVVLFPYFERQGDFSVVVMERNQESSLETLLERYPGHHIHLVRVEARGLFDLP